VYGDALRLHVRHFLFEAFYVKTEGDAACSRFAFALYKFQLGFPIAEERKFRTGFAEAPHDVQPDNLLVEAY
jgi:hypothetical protein